MATTRPRARAIRAMNLILAVTLTATLAACADSGPDQPAPTPSDRATGACAAAPSACGFPDGSNSGVPRGITPTAVTRDIALTTPGMVFEGQDVHGCVEVRADNVTIRNTRIVGTGCQYALRNLATGLTITDTEVTCGDSAGTAIASSDFTATRTNVHGCENGFSVSGRVTIRDSWVHDLYDANGTHTDGVQLDQGAESVVLEHNTIISPVPGGTSAIILWNEEDPQNRTVTIADNLLAGGTWTLYCPRADTAGIRVVGNRFGAHEFGPAAACTAGHVAEFSGNIADDTGQPVTP